MVKCQFRVQSLQFNLIKHTRRIKPHYPQLYSHDAGLIIHIKTPCLSTDARTKTFPPPLARAAHLWLVWLWLLFSPVLIFSILDQQTPGRLYPRPFEVSMWNELWFLLPVIGPYFNVRMCALWPTEHTARTVQTPRSNSPLIVFIKPFMVAFLHTW